MLDFIFQLSGGAALIGWIGLIFVPRWRGLADVVTICIIALLAVAYASLIGVWWSQAHGGFNSLNDVAALFQTRGALLAGWLHYLAFDLFVGRYIVTQTHTAQMRHWSIVPALILTFLFGPIGLLTFWAQRLFAQLRKPAWRAPDVVKALIAREPDLVASSALFLAFMIPTLLAYALDDRVLAGVNVWLKPLKFEASLSLYFLTMAWFFPLTDSGFRASRLGRFVVWGAIIPSAGELAYIVFRAAQGQASHFNAATPTAAALYALMGVGAIILTSASAVLAWGVYRAKSGAANPTYRFAAIIGLALTAVLGIVQGLILGGSPGHSVGTAVANDVMVPVMGWSRTIGDLRVSHFLAIHAEQVIPAFGALVAAMFAGAGRLAVALFALLYIGLTVAALIQAKMALPLLPL